MKAAINLTLGLALSLGLVACGSVETKGDGTNNASAKKESVANYYSGYFFDAAISGLNVVPLKKKASKPKMKNYIRYDNVRWQLTGKVDGGIVVRVRENARSANTIGTIKGKPQVSFIALEGQRKSTVARLSKSKDVFVDGSGVVSSKNYATDNRLPAGAYIIRIKVHGTENWDRKEVYIEVK
jgi:hypothetical protein